jgi:hypothetical protein
MRAEILPSHAVALLMRRVQDANMQEVRRVTNLLLRIKHYERQMGTFEKDDENRSICFPGCTRKKRGLAFSVKMSKHDISLKYRELA